MKIFENFYQEIGLSEELSRISRHVFFVLFILGPKFLNELSSIRAAYLFGTTADSYLTHYLLFLPLSSFPYRGVDLVVV